MGNILATCCRTEEADEKNKEISQKGEVPISRNLIKDTEKSPILKREVEGISYTFYLFFIEFTIELINDQLSFQSQL